MVIDAYGNAVSPHQATYVSEVQHSEFGGAITYWPNPNYDWGAGAAATQPTPAPPPEQFQINFDTIGQTIVRSIGNTRLPLRPIWAQKIKVSGDEVQGPTLTFAGAVCWPFDPAESGAINRIWLAGNLVYDPSLGGTGVVPPTGSEILQPGESVSEAALLLASLLKVYMLPGDEAQQPDPLITVDKGAGSTTGFRGLRYVVVPNFPIKLSGGALPQLSIEFVRDTPLTV